MLVVARLFVIAPSTCVVCGGRTEIASRYDDVGKSEPLCGLCRHWLRRELRGGRLRFRASPRFA